MIGSGSLKRIIMEPDQGWESIVEKDVKTFLVLRDLFAGNDESRRTKFDRLIEKGCKEHTLRSSNPSENEDEAKREWIQNCVGYCETFERRYSTTSVKTEEVVFKLTHPY